MLGRKWMSSLSEKRLIMEQYELTLYVTGQSANSVHAMMNLKRICDENLPEKCKIEIIDVLEQPQVAEEQKILATPTLIKTMPPPTRRIIGDLSDKGAVLQALDISCQLRDQERTQL